MKNPYHVNKLVEEEAPDLERTMSVIALIEDPTLELEEDVSKGMDPYNTASHDVRNLRKHFK